MQRISYQLKSLKTYGLALLISWFTITIHAKSTETSPQQQPTKHYGTLLTHPLSTRQFKLTTCDNNKTPFYFEQKWYVIFLAPKICNPSCAVNTKGLQTIIQALGINKSRVKALAIFYPHSYPQHGSKVVQQACLTFKSAEKQKHIFAQKKLSIEQGTLLIADPKHHIFLVYPHHFWQEILLIDLKRLLKS